MKKHGKKYQDAVKTVQEKLTDDTSAFTLEEAIEVLGETSTVSFDASTEIHIRLGIDPSKGEQMVRSTVSLPHGTGKKIRVIAFVPDAMEKEAKSAGALEAGSDILINKVAKGWLDFDTVVAHPDLMKNLGKVAKILGPKGLMPNPKAGTVTPDVSKAISDLIKGRVEFRNDKQGNLHNVFGRVSFGKDKLLENLKAYLRAIIEAKPSTLKGTYIRSVTLSTTMGPGIPINTADVARP